MAIAAEKLGAAFDAGRAVIDGERARAYALATNDDNPLYRDGVCAPPVFGAVVTWGAMQQAMTVIPAEAQHNVVHAERDMHFHRPLVAGLELHTIAYAHSWRVGDKSTRYTIRIASNDPKGELVLEQFVTMFIGKMNDGASAGPDKPDHAFPDDARAHLVGSHALHVDDDQTYRYRDASGDDMRIHIDPEFAKKVGLPGIIAHGVCTMAMVGQSALRVAAQNDPRRMRRLGVRWSKPVFPGADVKTSVYRAGERSFAFESSSGDQLVVTNGRLDVA